MLKAIIIQKHLMQMEAKFVIVFIEPNNISQIENYHDRLRESKENAFAYVFLLGGVCLAYTIIGVKTIMKSTTTR